MSWMQGALLGLVQGLTEFLPVSSSGHLALAQAFFELDLGAGAFVEVLLHLGTALAIMVAFRAECLALVKASVGLLMPGQWKQRFANDRAFRTVVLIILSAIPAGVLGILFKERVEGFLKQPAFVGWCLVATGVMLAVTHYLPRGKKPVGVRTAVIMGFAQAIAVLPGISRSGATISAGQAAGADREEVGSFAFLMALAPILGAALITFVKDASKESAPPLGPALLGAAVAFISGYFALKFLLRFVARGRLALFAPYCILLGGVAIAVYS